MKIKQTLIVFSFILLQTVDAAAQNIGTISAQIKDPIPYWNAPYCFGLRTVIGYEKSFYAELGLSYHKAHIDIVAPSAMCFYTSFEWVPTILPEKELNIYSLKTGFEWTGNIGVSAIELKYQSDFLDRNDFVITPKLGLGLFGIANILYGYNFSTNGYPFDEVGKHQVSLVCNIDRILLKDK